MTKMADIFDVTANAIQRRFAPEYGYCEASGLSRLLMQIGSPRQETEDPNAPFDPDTNPMKIKIDTVVPFAILTAWKDRLPPEGMSYDEAEQTGSMRVVPEKENWARNRKMLNTLNAARMGAYKLIGFFQNPPEGMTYDEARDKNALMSSSREESFFVIKPEEMAYSEFKDFIEKLAFGADQWAYIICDGNEVFEISQAGSRSLGKKVLMSKIQQAYSRMRGYGDKPFVFAGTVGPTDMGQKRWFVSEGLRWVEAGPGGLGLDEPDPKSAIKTLKDVGTDIPPSAAPEKIAFDTSKRGGMIDTGALVPRVVLTFAEPEDEILDFGAGEKASQTKLLRSEGLNVTAYDFPGFMNENHDPHALDRQYDIVFASNVLNVSSSQEMLRGTLKQIKDAVKKGGTAVFNYPKSPRKWRTDKFPNGVPTEAVKLLIQEVFGHSPVRIWGSKDEPVWQVGA